MNKQRWEITISGTQPQAGHYANRVGLGLYDETDLAGRPYWRAEYDTPQRGNYPPPPPGVRVQGWTYNAGSTTGGEAFDPIDQSWVQLWSSEEDYGPSSAPTVLYARFPEFMTTDNSGGQKSGPEGHLYGLASDPLGERETRIRRRVEDALRKTASRPLLLLIARILNVRED